VPPLLPPGGLRGANQQVVGPRSTLKVEAVKDVVSGKRPQGKDVPKEHQTWIHPHVHLR
jgi:hypothetical protein